MLAATARTMRMDAEATKAQPSAVAQIVRAADLVATFVFATEGALAGFAAGLDPVGVVAIAFVSAVGGGILRDLLLGATPVAAISNWRYAALVLAASALTWLLHPLVSAVPTDLLVPIEAMGLALATVAGTEKALSFHIQALPALFVAAVGATGGGVIRDVILNRVPRVLYLDIYATAAVAGAVIIVVGARLGWPPRLTAVAAALGVFTLRMVAATFHWQLPRAG